MTALRIRFVGSKCSRFALVNAENEIGQDFLDEQFDFLVEHFCRGHLILDMTEARELAARALEAKLPVLLDASAI